jgi:hypothetical protein
MLEDDLKILRMLINTYNLADVVSGLGSVVSQKGLDLAPVNAHLANEWMRAAVAIDGLVLWIENSELV